MKRRSLKIIPALLLTLCLLLFCVPAVYAQDTVSRPSECGRLHLSGTQLMSEAEEPVVLRGVSTHGITFYPEILRNDLFQTISEDWNCNFIRLAVYSSEYSRSEKLKKQSLDLLDKGIAYAAENDMYVLCDWHVLEEEDPNRTLSDAMGFFGTVSNQYADSPHILYEICNEPNGETDWQDVKHYAEQVIPVIKANDPDAVILVGTPNFDTDLASALEDPIEGYSNILYTFHFYSNSHFEQQQEALRNALDNGLPVFVSECGIVSSDGDGAINYENTAKWFELLKAYNISFAVWNLSPKAETSAMLRTTANRLGKPEQKDLTPCGQYVKALLQGQPLSAIPSSIDTTITFAEKWKGNTFFAYGIIAAGTVLLLPAVRLIAALYHRKGSRTYDSLLQKTGTDLPKTQKKDKKRTLGKVSLIFSVFFTVVYLTWRFCFSLPHIYGKIPSLFSVLLLLIEVLGFFESCIHYSGMIRLREYPLPEISEEEYPDVDIFVATYNEPAEVLRKTLIGCRNLRYPDKNKVHIYLCDDNRRQEMRHLAEEVGVNYFDRPDNSGAKAGNLNAAMARTDSPYIVTLDADMIPREEFLLKTIPYFVDAEKRNAALPEGEQMPLGLLQTPQCFYNPDVFQYNLYAEKRIPNEQDFFYRTIEPAKTTSNSVIYGGSNTVLSRKALNDIGGFYTHSITEDFATGLLIESKGYISLGLSEPLASGLSPSTFREHIQQRTRWGRGVIVTAKKLRFLRSKGLTVPQKLSYLSSVLYWYSPVKNWFYVLSPLIFAVLGIPVLLCSLKEILLFWLPMFLFQSLTLRLISAGSLSTKRSGIQETSVMPFLFFPVLKETVGITLSTFKVTEKKAGAGKRQRSLRSLLPFLSLILLSVFGIVRVLVLLCTTHNFSLVSVLYWLTRNLYFLLMCLFLVDGRDGNGENVIVTDAEPLTVHMDNRQYTGITTRLTEHSVSVFADELSTVKLGQPIALTLNGISLSGTVVSVRESIKPHVPTVFHVEILDFNGKENEYLYLLYNRIPTLPQNLNRDIGFFRDLWINLVRHLAAQTKY